jgi:hypothetical protein
MLTKIQVHDLEDNTGAPAGQVMATQGDGSFVLQAPAVGSASGTVVVYDEDTLLGSADNLRFYGDGVTVVLSGTFAHIDIPAGGPGGSGLGVFVTDEGVPLGTGTTLDFTGAGVAASISGTVVNVDIGGGGAGSGSARALGRASIFAAPGGSDDDEFDDETIDGSWTEVQRGADSNSYLEKYERLYYRHTDQAGGTRDLHVQLKSATIPTGTYIEAAYYWQQVNNFLGPCLIFADGTTFGSGEQIVAWSHENVANSQRTRMNGFSNFNSIGADGTNIDLDGANQLHFVRLRYEAVNTWGLYVSRDGIEWSTVQTDYSKTLTPTHFGVGAVHFDQPAAIASWFSFLYFRVDPADD